MMRRLRRYGERGSCAREGENIKIARQGEKSNQNGGKNRANSEKNLKKSRNGCKLISLI
jgi:hypothetical protein